MSATPEKSFWRSLFTEGVFLACASAYAYFLTFEYEAGYCSAFNVPATLINPNLATVLMVAAAISSVAATFNYIVIGAPWKELLNFHKTLESNLKPWWQKLVAGIFVFGVLFLFIHQIISWWFEPQHPWLVAYIIFGILVTSYLILIAAIIPAIKWCLVNSPKIVVDQPPTDDFFGHLRKQYPEYVIALLGLVILLPALTNVFGFFKVFGQHDFMFLNNHDDYALVRAYGDTLIASKIDRNSGCIGKDILVLKGRAFETVEMHLEKIEHLKNSCGTEKR